MFPTVLFSQGTSGHKRAPSDASVASSEDDKVPPTQSTLESVIEKPAEDQINEKVSDKGLKPSETKGKEVSQAARNEDLVPASIVSKDLSPQEPGEPKEDIPAEESVVPPEAVEPQQEASVNTPDTEKLATGGQETEEEKEKQEEKTNNDLNQEEEKKEMEEKEHLETGREEQSEAGVEKSTESEEQPKDAPEEPESVESAQEEKKGDSEGPEEVPSVQEVAEDKVEDATDSAAVNKGTEKIEPDLKETSAGGGADAELRAVEAPAAATAAAATEEEQEETTQEHPEEKNEGEAPEETVLPQQDSQPRQDVKVEDPTPDSSGVSDVVSKTSEDTEPVAPRKEEEAARADDNSCQDAVSVPESETDSESKTEQGSPAVVKPDVEKDSDSGSSSAADNSSLDLNLSISSFLSKSKEGGSVSMQVSRRVRRPAKPLFSNHCPFSFSLNFLLSSLPPPPWVGGEASEKDPEEDAEVPGGRRGGQRDDVQDSDGQRCQRRGDAFPEVCVCSFRALLILVRQCNVAHLTYTP